MRIQQVKIPTLTGLAILLFASIPSVSLAGGNPWELKGLEAVWSSGHRTHPKFMEVRRHEYETQIAAKTEIDPWIPKGLEAVWSHAHSTHPDFMNIRQREFETQINTASN